MRLTLPVALSALLLTLTACAKPSSPTPLPPSLCADVAPEPVLPEGASIVQPVTEEERAGTRAFLNWTAEVLDWGRRNAARAETAKKAC